jgi:hypothetical protein
MGHCVGLLGTPQWEHRNGIIHSKETGLLINNLNAEIQEQYQVGTAGIMQSVQPIFAACEASTLQFSIKAKQLWLHRIKQSRQRYCQQDHAVTQSYAQD